MKTDEMKAEAIERAKILFQHPAIVSQLSIHNPNGDTTDYTTTRELTQDVVGKLMQVFEGAIPVGKMS